MTRAPTLDRQHFCCCCCCRCIVNYALDSNHLWYVFYKWTWALLKSLAQLCWNTHDASSWLHHRRRTRMSHICLFILCGAWVPLECEVVYKYGHVIRAVKCQHFTSFCIVVVASPNYGEISHFSSVLADRKFWIIQYNIDNIIIKLRSERRPGTFINNIELQCLKIIILD